MKRAVVALALLLLSVSAYAAGGLRIVAAGPVGQTRELKEVNEIRIVFSEPMVVLGKIPDPVTAPYVHITPAMKGQFRWSGTTTLIFAPDMKTVPTATQYSVTIDANAKSLAGHTLDQPYRFDFTTPTIRLVQTQWYRKGGKAGAPIVILLSFNQPVDAATILPHLKLLTTPHDVPAPYWSPEGRARAQKLEPDALVAFDKKAAQAKAAASQNGNSVFVSVATDWDKKKYAPAPELLVLETKPGVPPDIWMKVLLDEKLARPGRVAAEPQEFTIQLEPTLVVSGQGCVTKCDPDYGNSIEFRSNIGLDYDAVRKAVTVTDITDPAKEVILKPKQVERDYNYPSTSYRLDELGYSLLPAHNYAIRVDASLRAGDDQTLDYTWFGAFDNLHRSAFISFGSGHGVWESTGGPILPFHARNFRSVKQWLAPLSLDKLMPLMQKMREDNFQSVPPGVQPQTRKLNVTADKIQSYGLDLSPAIGKDNLGIAWAAVESKDAIERSQIYEGEGLKATIVQSTNLGISVKDSPQNTLVFVTRLDDAKPVAGATVSIRDRNNKVVFTGTTDATGLVEAPNTDLRRVAKEKKEGEAENDPDDWEVTWNALSNLHFLVSAEKDGDVAYVGSDWTEGLTPWEFGVNFDIRETDPLVRGTIFSDRGVYKLGEEIHFKAVVRADTPKGMQLLPAGTKIDVTLRDSSSRELDHRSVALNAWSSGEWTFKLPADAPLGTYFVQAKLAEPNRGEISGNFLVAAYRRPEFRVDAKLDGASALAGAKLNGRITGKYLFGGAMNGRPVKWTYTKQASYDVPEKITDRWPTERFTFLGWDDEENGERGKISISENEATLNASGDLKLTLDTEKNAEGWPYDYTLEGVVTDVTRQQIAGRASFRVHPASFYIGVKTPDYFSDTTNGIDTEVLAAGLDGLAVPGVTVKIELKKLQWTSVRSAEGDGFYGWESEKKEVPAGEWTVKTAAQPAPLHMDIKQGGEYHLVATATDAQGRVARTRLWFYAVGEGYTAWERYDHNRIDLVPEKTTYKPGDTARIMVKSPWETATALLTTEREGVRTWKRFEIKSTQQTITVPITEKDIPNLFVSVLLLKGRTKQDPGKDGSDPGKPAMRLGYVELTVVDASKRLSVDVKADRDEFRPASKAKIDITVKDAKGQPSQSEVTLWAVDYGVLSLTAFQTPDVLDSIYLRKALQVVNEDSRLRIVSRRVLTPKGSSDGGGGGIDAGPGMLRKDFRVLAFWVGSLTTDAKGHAKTEITLPESLTTYRIMAVAGDKQSRFGWAQNEIRINKPLMLTPSWPRFLSVGDKAHFGGVVHNQLKSAGKATVTIKSLNPDVLEITGDKQTIDIPAGGATEVRFDAAAKAIGDARIQMRVTMGSENDGFEDVIPVRVLVSPETVAAYGEAKPLAEEKLEIPSEVVPGFGGLRVDLASTQLVGLSEGARYLVDYPYGCAEQRSSGALALILTSHLGDAFTLPGIDTKKGAAIAQSTINELPKYQCGDGGYSYWPGECWATSPYLTSWVVHVLQRGKELGFRVNDDDLTRAYTYLESSLAEEKPVNEGWMPSYTAWQAFSVKVLTEGGRNEDSHLNRLYGYRDRMPLFGIAFLLDAFTAEKENGARPEDLRRRLLNAVLPEGGNAHVNELNDPYLVWFWSSDVRTTAIALDSLVRRGQDEEISKRMVRWLMNVRKGGRWGNTQENAWAMEALIDFYRKYESEVPDFTGSVMLANETLAKETFKGRSAEAKTKQFSMSELLAKNPPKSVMPVVLTREGTGTLYYMLRLRYASTMQQLAALDRGFFIERSYAIAGNTPKTTFKAGDLIEVTLHIRNTKERQFVAVTDPIPAGTEPVEAWFATTASDLAEQQIANEAVSWRWWERGGFDHVERHDDRVNLFATRLGEGDHQFQYMIRATTAGSFVTAPAHAEEMYEPEVFGRTATAKVEVVK
ncbi:MAG TPA: alpha-2-macroglobulin family protein [Thermoanaerobaculia bacterium]|nr:alpha-2-macroglobulin family protein [Thermoanaerobaculia bacterium]